MTWTDPAMWAGIIIALAVIASAVRLLIWHRKAPTGAQAPRWRVGLLIVLTAVCGALLYLTLFPPAAVIHSGDLIVATKGSPSVIEHAPNDILIALPEAGPVTDAVRVPDLATALRRYPQPRSLRIVGGGLTPRDRAPMPAPLTFAVPPPPRGLVGVTIPDPVAPGAPVAVGGQVGSLPAGFVELLDPAGTVADRIATVAGQRFVLNASARAPGLALFELRLKDAAGNVVEQIAVPVETREQTPPKVLVLAGAPGPETKFLGRWAQDSGIDLSVDIDLGAGVRVGDAPVALTRQSLGELDLVVLDDRRWEAMAAGSRSALTEAVAGGLGLLLRPTGPLSAATRRDWAGLGLALNGGDESVPLSLDPPEPTAPVDPATETEAQAEEEAEPLPELARRDIDLEGSGAIAMVRDGAGVALASWRARGNGRVGVWTVTDSYALILTGRADRYGEMWSALFSALARAGENSRAEVQGIARVGVRSALCRLNGAPSVEGPEGLRRALQIDPATGERACAAFWPERAGWHLIKDGQGRETSFYVQPADAAPSLIAAADREATLALAAATPSQAVASTSRAPGSPWPWFAALLIAAAVLWWLERQKSAGPMESPARFLSRTVELPSRRTERSGA